MRYGSDIVPVLAEGAVSTVLHGCSSLALSHGVKERDTNNTPTVSYTRGIDLSGTLEGAGGIGGLLARSSGYGSGNWSTHQPYHCDGNGNITYLETSLQGLAASYRYDPFGNIISSSGTYATANTYRFSSKEFMTNSAMYYYGYRFYDPNMQRWITRDPLGELGGINLYAFARNSPVRYVDPYGLAVDLCAILRKILASGQLVLPDTEIQIQALMIQMGCDGGGPKRPIPGRKYFPDPNNFLPFDPALNRNCLSGGPQLGLQPAAVSLSGLWNDLNPFEKATAGLGAAAAGATAGTLGTCMFGGYLCWPVFAF